MEDIYAGLSHLKNEGIIDCSGEREGDYTYLIRVNIDNIRQASHPAPETKKGLKNIYFNDRELRQEILQLPRPCRAELFQGILTFVPPEEDLELLEGKITQWLEDFPADMIKELIRRVDKWQARYDNPAEGTFHYLKGLSMTGIRKRPLPMKNCRTRINSSGRSGRFPASMGWQNGIISARYSWRPSGTGSRRIIPSVQK